MVELSQTNGLRSDVEPCNDDDVVDDDDDNDDNDEDNDDNGA